MPVQFSIRGLSQLQTKLTNAAVKYKPVAEKDLLRFGELVMNDAKERYVPVDQGDLQASGKAEIWDEPGLKGVAVRLSFSGRQAIAIHELPDFNPPSWGGRTDLNWTKSGTGAKYLELPVMKHSKDLAVIAASVWIHLWTGPEQVA